MDALLSGESYDELPDTYVIFICDFAWMPDQLYRRTQGHQEGLQKGLQQGWSEGRREALKESVLNILANFGEIPEDIRLKIEGQEDETVLKEWLNKAAKADSIEAFRVKM